jgi:hypothetical protein
LNRFSWCKRSTESRIWGRISQATSQCGCIAFRRNGCSEAPQRVSHRTVQAICSHPVALWMISKAGC